MQGNYCEPARELSVSEKTLELAKDLATLSEEIATRVEHKLSPISWPEPPVPEKLGTAEDNWPEYFSMLRGQLKRIQEAQRRIDNALDRTGI